MTTTTVVSDPDRGRVLSAEELFAGGDEPTQRLELPMVRKKGNPGVVYIRKISMDEVFEHQKLEDDSVEKHENQLRLFTKAVCKNKEGDQMFTDEHDKRLGEVSVGAFNLIMGMIVGDMAMEKEVAEAVAAAKND